MTHVLYYDPFKPNQGQVHDIRQYYELQVVSDTLLCRSVIISLIRLLVWGMHIAQFITSSVHNRLKYVVF